MIGDGCIDWRPKLAYTVTVLYWTVRGTEDCEEWSQLLRSSILGMSACRSVRGKLWATSVDG